MRKFLLVSIILALFCISQPLSSKDTIGLEINGSKIADNPNNITIE